jgi:plasmid replication initiation protein
VNEITALPLAGSFFVSGDQTGLNPFAIARRISAARLAIADLRRWLKVPENAYPDWKNFRHRVLRPAVEQINNDPMGAGFTVEYEPVRKGRFYHEIVFKMKKTEHRKAIDKGQKDKMELARKIESAKATGRPHLREAAIQSAREATNYVLDMNEMQSQFWAFWESTGKPEFNKGVDNAFIGFCKTKKKQLN